MEWDFLDFEDIWDPDTDVPDIDMPDTDVADADAPGIDITDTHVQIDAETDVPETDVRDDYWDPADVESDAETDQAETDAPDIDVPDIDVPESDAQIDVNNGSDTDYWDPTDVEIDVPESGVETDAPDTDVPATNTPDTDVDMDIPETNAPDTDYWDPDTDVPDIDVETAMPEDTDMPESDVPESEAESDVPPQSDVGDDYWDPTDMVTDLPDAEVPGIDTLESDTQIDANTIAPDTDYWDLTDVESDVPDTDVPTGETDTQTVGPLAGMTEVEFDTAFEAATVPLVTGGQTNPHIAGHAVPTSKKPRLDVENIPLRPGETLRQALDRVHTVVGMKLSDIPMLNAVWNNARAHVLRNRTLTSSNYSKLYNYTRYRFWQEVRKDPMAMQHFTDAGFIFPARSTTAPLLATVGAPVPVEEIRVSLDHVLEKAIGDNWTKALDADNLRMEFAMPNTYREIIQRRHQELRPGTDGSTGDTDDD